MAWIAIGMIGATVFSGALSYKSASNSINAMKDAESNRLKQEKADKTKLALTEQRDQAALAQKRRLMLTSRGRESTMLTGFEVPAAAVQGKTLLGQ